MYAPTPPLHAAIPSMTHSAMSETAMSSVSTSMAPMLLPEQEQYFKSVQRQYNHMEKQQLQIHQQQQEYVKPTKRSKKSMRKSRMKNKGNGIGFNRNMDSMQNRAYQSDASVASYASSHSNKSATNNGNDDSSILGSFTSMAFGYIMGGPTPQ